jgi:SPP1 gp7 family putative phage head morphogenesis protein
LALNDRLLDRMVSHSIFMERYKGSTLQEIIKVLDETDKRIVEQVRTKTEGTFTEARLQMLLQQLRQLNSEATTALNSKLREELQGLAEYETGFQKRMIEDEIPIEWAIAQPAPDQVFAAAMSRPFEGTMLSDAIEQYSRARQRLIENAVRQGFTAGETTDQIVRRVRGSRTFAGAGSALHTTRSDLRALVHTAVQHTATTAREELYRENADLIKGTEWVSTLDSRTTLICANLDGKVDLTDGTRTELNGRRPPAHWGCRSTTVPITRSWRELGVDMDEAPEGTRPSVTATRGMVRRKQGRTPADVRRDMTGEVPASTDFRSWLGRQSEELQREVLGARRFKMWKEGADISRFVQDGRVLTLSELGQLEGAA